MPASAVPGWWVAPRIREEVPPSGVRSRIRLRPVCKQRCRSGPLRGTNSSLPSLWRIRRIRPMLHAMVQTMLVVAVGLSSVGFTRIVGYCSMSDSSECCCGNDKKCDLPASRDRLYVASVGNSCYSVRVVGGPNDIRGIASPENVPKPLPLHSIVELPPASGQHHSHYLAALSYLRSDHSPPPDKDIYTLTHSLLI